MRDPSAIENYPPPEARRGRSTEPSSVPRSPRQLAAAAAVGVAMDGGGAAPPDAARSTSPAPMMAAAPAGISTFLQPFFLPPSHQIHVFLSSCRLETTARPCRANVGGSQCLTGAALRSIFVSCPSSLAAYTYYFIASNNFVVLVMISAEKRSVCVAYIRGRPARDAAI